MTVSYNEYIIMLQEWDLSCQLNPRLDISVSLAICPLKMLGGQG